MADPQESKILVIGGTGYIGRFIIGASAKANHPSFVLVGETNMPRENSFKISRTWMSVVTGDLHDGLDCLAKVIKQVDVVISAVNRMQLVDQTKIIAAIKEAGNVKRFFPSEFGNDADRAEGIPYTYVSSNCFAGYFLPTLAQPGATSPPRDKVIIVGDGNPKEIFVKEEDISTYTIRAVDDPRTLNKVLYLKPPKNIYSFNELVALCEKKFGKALGKVNVPEDKLLNDIIGQFSKIQD
ncbi:putative eugenol synthase [Rosa chinensis]|uniref:Putative eugenol synthase n=1 Tax=Rosa chinensis TaxID=74649 RepID=A0A2P6PYQ4_ROSCH|nr:putative eugenol synthase [Rosa chinensis]